MQLPKLTQDGTPRRGELVPTTTGGAHVERLRACTADDVATFHGKFMEKRRKCGSRTGTNTDRGLVRS